MTERFHGPWSVAVQSTDSAYDQRFVISGSTNADSDYPGTPGTNVAVSGDTWNVDLEWNDNVASGWQPSAVRRQVEYTITDGLTVTLGADDNTLAIPDLDYNDMVLTCRSLDPGINPPMNNPPLVFTITEDQIQNPD